MKETLGKFTALRMDNGEVIEGNLIYRENSPFVYILTEENFNKIKHFKLKAFIIIYFFIA